MFPFTFDSKHFLPANDTYTGANGYTLKDIFIDCVGINAIFAIKTDKAGCTFEDFMQFEDAVILDIDISVAHLSPIMSTGPLPRFPDEFGLLRLLNTVKNKKLPEYDLISPQVEKEYDNIDYIPSRIRHTFRQKFESSIIRPALKCIRVNAEKQRDYYDIFDREKFLEERAMWDDTTLQPEEVRYNEQIIFAERLVDQSTPFIHFIEGFLTDDILNFDVFSRIIRGDNARCKAENVKPDRFHDKLLEKLRYLNGNELELLRRHSRYQEEVLKEFQDKPVQFNFKMPSANQQGMLFEKIEFFVTDAQLRCC